MRSTPSQGRAQALISRLEATRNVLKVARQENFAVDIICEAGPGGRRLYTGPVRSIGSLYAVIETAEKGEEDVLLVDIVSVRLKPPPPALQAALPGPARPKA